MTLGEFTRCINGYKERIEREMQQQDYLNHIHANYIALGVNNPEKFPKQPLLSEVKNESKIIATTDDQRQKMVRIKYGKKN